jgi:hypothetical protein
VVATVLLLLAILIHFRGLSLLAPLGGFPIFLIWVPVFVLKLDTSNTGFVLLEMDSRVVLLEA